MLLSVVVCLFVASAVFADLFEAVLFVLLPFLLINLYSYLVLLIVINLILILIKPYYPLLVVMVLLLVSISLSCTPPCGAIHLAFTKFSDSSEALHCLPKSPITTPTQM